MTLRILVFMLAFSSAVVGPAARAQLSPGGGPGWPAEWQGSWSGRHEKACTVGDLPVDQLREWSDGICEGQDAGVQILTWLYPPGSIGGLTIPSCSGTITATGINLLCSWEGDGLVTWSEVAVIEGTNTWGQMSISTTIERYEDDPCIGLDSCWWDEAARRRALVRSCQFTTVATQITQDAYCAPTSSRGVSLGALKSRFD